MNEQDNGEHMRPDAESAPRAAMSAGEQLAAARESRGWSMEDVAAQLNLAPRQVHAIETGNHAALPGLAVTRGFIRAYAKLLKMDAAPLLATLGGEAPEPVAASAPRKALATPFAESRLPSLGERKRSSLPVIAVAAVVVLGAAGYFAVRNADMIRSLMSGSAPTSEQTAPAAAPQPAADTSASNAPVASEAAPVAVEPAASGAAGATPAPVPAAPADAVQPPVPPAPPAPEGRAPAAAPSQVSAQSPVPATSGEQANVLQLSAREESWIEVRRASGNGVILSRLMKAGESQTVEVSEPLALVVGNAGGVDLTLRGAPLPIKGGSGNVSKITVK